MNRIEEQLKKLNQIHLPQKVRERMRAELLSYAELHAVPATGMTVRSSLSTFRFRLYAGFSTALLLIATLGGTAYASESALPGDTLYTVKVGFAEPLQGALIPSDRGRAAWHAILAERRLEETAQLAAEGKLSTSTQDMLAGNFSGQVSASQESADRLEHKGDTSGSLSARSDLEARLAAHMQILTIIDQHYAQASSSNATDTHQALSRMLVLVEDHEHAVATSRIALEDQIAPNGAQNDQGGDSTTTVIAASLPAPAKARFAKHAHIVIPITGQAPASQIETAASARTTEVEDILEHHAALLKAFLPSASTTATSTVTSTTTTKTSSIPDTQDSSTGFPENH